MRGNFSDFHKTNIDTLNYFELYNLPVQFNLDQTALKTKYIELSKQLHPDMHTLADTATQVEMLERSTLNNNAYNTLKDDQKRIKYILQLHNMIEDEEQYQMPAEFLGEMMEMNEAVMGLQMEFDALEKEQAIQSLNDKVEALNQTALKWMDEFDEGKSPTKNLQKIKEYYFKLKYLNRLKENVDKLID